MAFSLVYNNQLTQYTLQRLEMQKKFWDMVPVRVGMHFFEVWLVNPCIDNIYGPSLKGGWGRTPGWVDGHVPHHSTAAAGRPLVDTVTVLVWILLIIEHYLV